MARYRNRSSVIRTRTLPNSSQTPIQQPNDTPQPNSSQSQNKQTTIAWVAAVGAVVSAVTSIIGIYLTNNALQLSIKQNETSDTRYFKNDSSSQVQQAINRRQDSDRNDRESVQTETLLKTYQQVLVENSRLRKRDSIQTAILLREFSLKNEELEIIYRNNTPFFKSSFGVEQPYGVTGNIIPFAVHVSLTNVGKSDAQQTKVSFFVVTIDVLSNRVVYCSRLDSAIFVREIKAGKTESLPRALNAQVLLKTYANQSTSSKSASNSSQEPYAHILVARVVSDDEYVSKRYENYYTNAYVCSSAGRNTYIFNPSYRSISYSLIRKYVEKYGFDYKLMVRQLGIQYTYVRSQYSYQY